MRIAREFLDQPTVTAGGVGLALQRCELATHLAQEVVEPQQVALGRLEAPLGALAPLAELQDPRGFLHDGATVLRTRVQHRVELALPHDDVLLAPDTGVGEQLLDVEESTGRAVDLVLGVAGPEQGASDRDLGELDGQRAGAVVDAERHLGPAERRAVGSADEDDVVHLPAAQRARSLGAEHPRHRVDQVRLTGAVRADHHRHTRFELEDRLVREGLEASQGQGLEEHGGGSGGVGMTGNGGRAVVSDRIVARPVLPAAACPIRTGPGIVTTPRSHGGFVAHTLPSSLPSVPGQPHAPSVAVPDAFRIAAAEHPLRVALDDAHGSLTYAEVDRASNRVADHLLERGGTERGARRRRTPLRRSRGGDARRGRRQAGS